MWIDKDIIPALIDAVEKTIKSELEAFDEADFNEDEHFDGNDLVIFDSFVLHTLRENIGKGFYSSEMLDKGFAYMMGLVQWYLRAYGDELAKICFGKLARLHYEYYLKEAMSYLAYIERENVWENIDYINNYIERAILNIERKTERLPEIPQPTILPGLIESDDNKVVPLRLVSDHEGME